MADRIIRARDLEPGDCFETLLTDAIGVRRGRNYGCDRGIPVELAAPGGEMRCQMLHPSVRVRVTGRFPG